MLDESDIKGAVDFHGHRCFGLFVGLCAAKIAMDRLSVSKSKGEELVVIAENNSCAVDAIQHVSGATLGRGNLIVKDWGKHAYTFMERKGGRAVRVVLSYDAFSKIGDREKRLEKLLSTDSKELFLVSDVTLDIPKEAEVERSVQCDLCREPAMRTRTKLIKGKTYCVPCYEKVYIGQSRKGNSKG